jgi:hypothetical protein
MRTIFRSSVLGLTLVAGFLTFGPSSPAQAAITRVTISGTTANLNLVTSIPGSRPDCKIDLWVTLMASASVTRSTNTTSTGAIGFVQRMDNCTDDLEFGSFNVALPATAFTSGTGTATLNATFPVEMASFGPAGGTVIRTLVIATQYKALENNSDEARSFGLIKSPGLTLITRSRSVFNAAGVTGTLKLDGVNRVTSAASIDSGIETGTSTTIDITR